MRTTGHKTPLFVLPAIIAISAFPASPTVSDELIPPPSIELERETQPWCPEGCTQGVPFVASYRKGSERLVFVGALHAFEPNHPTMRAVAAGFASIHPGVVILEGFPTRMGENPPPLVEGAKLYGAPSAPDFARGEGNYAASLALSHHIPFVGGEPTQSEQLEALKLRGFTEAEVAFSSLLGWFSQALRSGDMADTSIESLRKTFPSLAENVTAQWGMEAPTLDAFREHYRNLYGIDIVNDKEFTLRTDAVFDKTRQGDLSRTGMTVRDRHLWALIGDQLTRRKSVLVVYGGSHWSTLSVVLRERLGTPEIRPFLK